MESDIELLSQCAEFTLSHTNQAEEAIRNELQTSAATPLISQLRVVRLHKAVVAIGMLSLFESLLQDQMKWEHPFKDLKYFLEKDCKEPELSKLFDNYVLAIHVLKHGEGRSYDSLLERKTDLEFSVKLKDEPFFSEGDVSEVGVLIDVNDNFVRKCAILIQKVASILLLHGHPL